MKNWQITRIFKFQVLIRIFLGILIYIFGFSCKTPFSTREPEKPEDQQRTNWIQPTNPTDVLTNLKNAIQDKNLTNYLNSFTNQPQNSRQFGYKPDNSALIRYPGVWTQWALEHEQTYITNVFHAIPNDSVVSLIYFDIKENPLPDSTVIIFDYELVVGHTRNTDQFPKKVMGNAEFRLSLNTDGFWVIYFWVDDSFEGSSSWSDLKAAFIQ
jgi:hypothetical protein